jgi:DNA-binding NtrC family response regulator
MLATHETAQTPTVDHSRHAVLFVDADAQVRKTFQASFEDQLEVLTSSTAQSALKVLRRNQRVAVVVADEHTPELSGIGLLMRARQERPDVARMLLTQEADARILQEAINQAEVMRYVTKPWNADELLTWLRRGIELAVSRRPPVDLEDARGLISANIRRLRHEQRIKQEDLARLAGLDARTLGYLEQADGNPALSTLVAVASALGTDVRSLLTRAEPPSGKRVRHSRHEA